jgi:hypothetical protein
MKSSTPAPSSSSSTTISSILAIPVSEKLTKLNYPLWSAQVLPAIRVTQLDGLLTSDDLPPMKELSIIIDDKLVKQRNPAYSAWVEQDQTILGYLLSMLTRETFMMHVS